MLTQHAQARCKQRGIRSEVVDVLLDYGRRKRRHGAEICYLDQSAVTSVMNSSFDMGCKAYARIADRLHTYLVLSNDGRVVTVAKRFRRIVI